MATAALTSFQWLLVGFAIGTLGGWTARGIWKLVALAPIRVVHPARVVVLIDQPGMPPAEIRAVLEARDELNIRAD